MAFSSAADTLVFTACCVLFFVHGAKMAHDLSPEWRKGARETFAKLAQLLRSGLRMRGAAHELTEQVAARLMAWQLSHFQSVRRVFLLSITIFVGVVFCKVVLGVHRMNTVAQDVILIVSYAALLLADWCPWLVNKRTLDLWYSGLMCCVSLFVIPPFCASEQLLQTVFVPSSPTISRIAAPTPRLAAFLLRSTPVPLEHTPFEDLLQDEEDRERFRNLLCPAGPLPGNSFVELAHARMRGGSDTVFQVELFGYRFRGPGGHQRYLVGVREAGDFERGGMPMATSGPQPVAMSPLDEAVAVIDPYGAKMPILSCSPFFRIRIMPVAEGTPLLPAVVKGDNFEAWVQSSVNWHRMASDLDEEEYGDRPEESFVVTFKPRSRNVPTCTRALCRLKVEYCDDSSGESWDGQLRVELAFSHIAQVPRCLERADGGSSSSSSSSSGTPSTHPRMSLGGRQGGQPAASGARTSL